MCKIFSDNVQYKRIMNDIERTVIPDVSINCRCRQRRGKSFFNNPSFVMEVLSPSTEKYDRNRRIIYTIAAMKGCSFGQCIVFWLCGRWERGSGIRKCNNAQTYLNCYTGRVTVHTYPKSRPAANCNSIQLMESSPLAKSRLLNRPHLLTLSKQPVPEQDVNSNLVVHLY